MLPAQELLPARERRDGSLLAWEPARDRGADSCDRGLFELRLPGLLFTESS